MIMVILLKEKIYLYLYSSDFIQIHKSFVVNKNYIQEIKAKELILKNSTILPIGRNFKESI